MSGGPYGRGKAPERACMRVEDWPDQDRLAWIVACAPFDPLADDSGTRANHSAASNRKAEKGYGRWLTFLLVHDAPALEAAAADRITPARVRTYVDSLSALGNGTATILARLQELGEAATVMDPRKDWRFLRRLASKIRAKHTRTRSKAHLRLSDELLDLGLSLIEQAGELEGANAAILHRDGLIIAFLALVPLRRRNLAGLRIDHNLIEVGGFWLITLDASETKTHAALDLMWPDELVAPLATYLEVHRPLLASLSNRWSRPVDNALWVSSHGSPMTEIAMYDRIRRHTQKAFGAAINPHLFRDAAATTLAIADPAHVRVAAPLLGHRTFTTTERFYQQARSFDAHRAYVDAIFGKGKRS